MIDIIFYNFLLKPQPQRYTLIIRVRIFQQQCCHHQREPSTDHVNIINVYFSCWILNKKLNRSSDSWPRNIEAPKGLIFSKRIHNISS